ncbi:MAG: amidohydrolase [Bacteroidales bacterium]|nr:amidohydrolase [Bacteroidales bacterium]
MDNLLLIKNLNLKFKNEIIGFRHSIHQNPELSFKEYETSNFIEDTLKKYNINCSRITETGIVAVIEGKKAGKTIALRADIDALPIEEKNNLPFKSKNNGLMHACGHDIHTASLLGSALILNKIKEHFSGKIILIFQPAEEKIPGGAKALIEKGILEKYKPTAILAQHVQPDIASGKIGLRAGKYMASTDEIYLSVTGKGGHAAMPHELIDTVLISASIITGLQHIVSRKANASIPTVLSFGKIVANGATNIIPDNVEIEGTFRTMDEVWRKKALKLIEETAANIAKTMGGECKTRIMHGYPFLENNEALSEFVKEQSELFLGKKNVLPLDIRMTAEDFSYFAQKIPGVMYRIGVGGSSKNENSFPLHSAHFNPDETVLEFSSGLMAWNAIQFLETNPI